MAEFDIVIKNGTIVDGTRVPSYRGDLAIKDGKVAAIGAIDASRAAEVIDATGLIVAPGFVDLHTHYDAQIQWDPYCTISGWHGVTSIALGNCGFGFAPVKPENRVRAMQTMSRNEAISVEAMEEGMLWDWETFPEWMDSLERMPKGVNCLTYAPLAPFMTYVMGLDAAKTRGANAEERKQIKRLLHEAMDAGACGWSVQRLGEHSVQCDFDGTPMVTDTMPTEDLLDYATVLKERGEGIIQVTMASGEGLTVSAEDRDLEEKIAEVSGACVLHNAFVALKAAPDYHREVLAWLADANARGLRIFGQSVSARADFIFTLDEWNLYDSSPAWNLASTGTQEEKKRKYADPEIRRAMKLEYDGGEGPGDKMQKTQGIGGAFEDLLVVGTPAGSGLDAFVGLTVGDIAKRDGKHAIDAMLDLALAGDLRVEFATPQGGAQEAVPELTAELFTSPYVLPGLSDGGAHTKFFTGGAFTTDMLCWLVRDTKKLSLEEAHFRLSMLPAFAAGFRDRGYLREGLPADIIVYDLEKLARVPEYVGEIVYDLPGGDWRRIQRAEGYRWTIVNGQITFKDGEPTGKLPGRLLRHGKAS